MNCTIGQVLALQDLFTGNLKFTSILSISSFYTYFFAKDDMYHAKLILNKNLNKLHTYGLKCLKKETLCNVNFPKNVRGIF